MSPLVKVLVAAVLASLSLSHASAVSDVSVKDTKEAFKAFVEKIVRGEIELTKENFPQEFAPYVDALRELELFPREGLIPRPKPARDAKQQELVCTACDILFAIIIEYAQTPIIGIDGLVEIVVGVCKTLQIVADPVCEGIIPAFAYPMDYVVNEMGDDAKPNLFCGLFVDEMCMSEETDAYANSWTVDLPTSPPKPPTQWPDIPSDGAEIKVLHITDVHVDLEYLPGSPLDCGMPACCMRSTGLAADGEAAAGYWGAYAQCATPQWTLDEMFRQMKEMVGDTLSYAVFTGDSPPHSVWNQSWEVNLDHSSEVIGLYKKHFPELPLYIAVGNHESFPVDVVPNSGITEEDYLASQLYEPLADLIVDWIGDDAEAIANFRRDGYYAYRPSVEGGGLKMIVLNTNFYGGRNVLSYLDFSDPVGQLAWLITELQESEDAGEKVHLYSHHKPESVLGGFQREFGRIVHRYANTVRFYAVGHNHRDFFQVWYDEEGVASQVVMVSPSIVTRDGPHPEFRVYTFDGGYEGASWQLKDYDAYIMDVEESNDPAVPPVFQHYYKATEAFGVARLRPEDFESLIERAAEDDAFYRQLLDFDAQEGEYEDPESKSEYLCERISGKECPYDETTTTQGPEENTSTEASEDSGAAKTAVSAASVLLIGAAITGL